MIAIAALLVGAWIARRAGAVRALAHRAWPRGRGGIAELRRLYPGALRLLGGRFELASAFSPIGEAADITILAPGVANPPVAGLEAFIGGVGD